MLLSLFGCSRQSYQPKIEFREDVVISQNARVDTCQYVERIDHSDIKEADIYDGEIHFNNIVLSCPVVDTSTAGPVKLIYTWNDLTYELLAIIRDTEAPIIEIDSKITIQVGDHFDMLDHVKVSDTTTSDEDLTVSYSGTYDTTRAGEYDISIRAVDDAGNISMAMTTLIVEEAPASDVDLPTQGSSSPSADSPQAADKQTQTTQPQASSGHSEGYTKFYSAAAYDMITASQLCADELTASGRAGSCVGVFDENNIYQGMQLTIN